MSIIHKFPIMSSTTHIRLCWVCLVLGVQVQHEQPHIWVLLENGKLWDQVLVERTFRLYCTGEDLDDGCIHVYIGTIQQGQLVRHLFEQTWNT